MIINTFIIVRNWNYPNVHQVNVGRLYLPIGTECCTLRRMNYLQSKHTSKSHTNIRGWTKRHTQKHIPYGSTFIKCKKAGPGDKDGCIDAVSYSCCWDPLSSARENPPGSSVRCALSCVYVFCCLNWMHLLCKYLKRFIYVRCRSNEIWPSH